VFGVPTTDSMALAEVQGYQPRKLTGVWRWWARQWHLILCSGEIESTYSSTRKNSPNSLCSQGGNVCNKIPLLELATCNVLCHGTRFYHLFH